MKHELEQVTKLIRERLEGLQDGFALLEPDSEIRQDIALDMLKLSKVLHHLEKANTAYNEYYTSHVKEVK